MSDDPIIVVCVHTYVLDRINAFGASDELPSKSAHGPDDLVAALEARSVTLSDENKTWLRTWPTATRTKVIEEFRKAESPRKHYKFVDVPPHGSAEVIRVSRTTDPIVVYMRFPAARADATESAESVASD